MSNESTVDYVNLKIKDKADGSGQFLKGYRKSTNENYFVFIKKDQETGEVLSRKLSRGPKVAAGEQSDLTDIGYLGAVDGKFGRTLECWGHIIGKNQYFNQGTEVEGVVCKTNKDGELLTFPSGDYIPMEEMTLTIDLAKLEQPNPEAEASVSGGVEEFDI